MNKPFEQRVVNYLERPTSSDLNIAQSQINANHRALQKYLMQAADGATFGAIGNSFRVTATVGMGLAIQPGLLTSGISTGEYLNIGSVTGLNDFYPQRTMFLSAARNLTIPTAPAAGLCRRDVIAVRYLQGAEGLTDNETTDIYNPLTVAFDSVNVSKTLTTDLLNAALEVIDYTQTPTQPIVYIKGQEFDYTGPDSFLTNLAPLTSVPGYANIAIINVGPNQTTFTAQDIIDHRRHAAPYGNITITGKATVGWDGTPGGELSNVVIKAPAGIRASIYKLGADAPSGEKTNSYVLAVFGARRVESASISVTPGIPNPDVVGVSGWRIYPVQALTGEILLNSVTTAASQAYFADPAKSAPTQQVAVNQGAHFFPFTLGTIETMVTPGTTTVTTPVINSDPGEIVIGESPILPYPGGTYDVINTDSVVRYYLNYLVSPTAPTTNLPAETYALSKTPTDTSPTYQNIDLPDTEQRIAGFVAEPISSTNELPLSVWSFTITARATGTIAPTLKAKLYLYDGTTNPEAGVLIASSDNALQVPISSRDQTFTFFMYVPQTALGANRLYIALYATGSSVGQSGITLSFNNDRSAFVEMSLADSAAISIPSPSSYYPAGTYSVANENPGEVAVTVPTLAVSQTTRFNPKSAVFQADPFFVDDYPTLPITFTVNLSML